MNNGCDNQSAALLRKLDGTMEMQKLFDKILADESDNLSVALHCALRQITSIW